MNEIVISKDENGRIIIKSVDGQWLVGDVLQTAEMLAGWARSLTVPEKPKYDKVADSG